MRLSVLDSGHPWSKKVLFRIIRLVSGHPAPDVVKMLMYRPAFFGSAMSAVVQQTMRGPSVWSVEQRELMAAFVSRVNSCTF